MHRSGLALLRQRRMICRGRSSSATAATQPVKRGRPSSTVGYATTSAARNASTKKEIASPASKRNKRDSWGEKRCRFETRITAGNWRNANQGARRFASGEKPGARRDCERIEGSPQASRDGLRVREEGGDRKERGGRDGLPAFQMPGHVLAGEAIERPPLFHSSWLIGGGASLRSSDSTGEG